MTTPAVYVKYNPGPFPDALYREAEGLQLLRKALAEAGVKGVRVPSVYAVSESRLDMTAVESRPATTATLTALGEGLAAIHRLPRTHFGLDTNNYIGLSPQVNRLAGGWGRFFLDDRLGFQVSQIKDLSVREVFSGVLAKCGSALSEWLDEHCDQASLLHGDLWSGNVLHDGHDAWLIDPAVYVGDREADLAMTEMFGGFGVDFYRAYDRCYPRTQVYSVKRDIYNLYHYLNHYNLFGRSYLQGCRRGFEVVRELVLRGG